MSPATIDRMLIKERKKLVIKGRSHARAGTTAQAPDSYSQLL
jgi:hypothetical protein